MTFGYKKEIYAAWLMVFPALAGLFIFVAVPFAMAVMLAHTNLRMGSPLPIEFVGFEQFRRIFTDYTFQRALLNNGIFALVVVPLQTSLALALAMLLNQRLAGMAFFRTLFFMPVVFPMSLTAVIWILIFAPGPDALMNTFLKIVTFGTWKAKDFLHEPFLAFPAIMLMSIWQGVGFQMIIILAGLQGIPAELYEAAAIDGAGGLARFFYITLPQLRNTLIFVSLVTTILAFRLFDQIQIMTRGGPNKTTTTVMYELVHTAFDRQQIGRAAAMTVVFFLLVLVLTWAQRRLVRQEREIE
jgi:multiple sugar transport system permease protein